MHSGDAQIWELGSLQVHYRRDWALKSCRPDLTDWPTIGALLGELSRRLGPARRMRLAWRRDFDAVESPFRWIVEHGGTHEDSAMADRESCDNPGEAVGRALLAVLRAERVKP